MIKWDRAGIELAPPGYAVRHASVARHVTDFVTRPEVSVQLAVWLRRSYHENVDDRRRRHRFTMGSPAEKVERNISLY